MLSKIFEGQKNRLVVKNECIHKQYSFWTRNCCFQNNQTKISMTYLGKRVQLSLWYNWGRIEVIKCPLQTFAEPKIYLRLYSLHFKFAKPLFLCLVCFIANPALYTLLIRRAVFFNPEALLDSLKMLKIVLFWTFRFRDLKNTDVDGLWFKIILGFYFVWRNISDDFRSQSYQTFFLR